MIQGSRRLRRTASRDQPFQTRFRRCIDIDEMCERLGVSRSDAFKDLKLIQRKSPLITKKAVKTNFQWIKARTCSIRAPKR
jgi:hypothetical protein